MKKVFVLAPRENWIVDRFVKEWNEDNSDISVSDPSLADVIWLLADWAWNQVPPRFLTSRKVLTTVHHVVPIKFGPAQQHEFAFRDGFTTAYHVPNAHTRAFIQSWTSKPIHTIPYWANQKIWHSTGTKEGFRRKYNIPLDAYVVGSFQRDTEGSDLVSPKLEKGPDLLADFVKATVNKTPVLHVLLAGWRRQYIISRLESMTSYGPKGVPYTYIEQPNQEVINELYQCLDLYPVTARFEGGPQSLIECGLLNVPVVSRPVGIASVVLSPESINDDVSLAQPSVPNVDHLKLPNGYEPYRQLIESL